MKKLLIIALAAAMGWALASTPAYPENSLGLGAVYPAAGELTVGLALPFAPLGMDTGLDLAVRYPRLGVSASGQLLVLPSLTKECESHMEKHSQGSQLNATLHTAMNAHITNLRMLALPPEQLQAQLPPAQPPKSKIIFIFYLWFN